jgi:hypothetical protein
LSPYRAYLIWCHRNKGSVVRRRRNTDQGDPVLQFFSLAAGILRSVAAALDRIARHSGASGRNTQSPDTVLNEYVHGMPNAQNVVDALPGWNHALPPCVAVTAGHAAFYDDSRIHWALEQFGSIRGKKILELGPLEASHTYMLDMRTPEFIHAIEANKLSFLRCLVVKELLDFKHTRFFLGDFVPWLQNTPMRYDLIVASGVLYHMQDPVRLLELIAQRSDAFYLWTHYASEDAMPPDDPRRGAFLGAIEFQERHGISVRLYPRSYHGAWRSKSFCGGMHDLHRWVQKDDIVTLIRALGFEDVRIAHDDPVHRNGPSFSVFARR